MTRQPPTLDGFEPIRLLGSGGYADVFLYRQVRLDREVAIKVLHAPAAAADVMAEAGVMAKLRHPYIVQVYEADTLSDGRPFIVMEPYPNGNLLQRANDRPLPAPEVLKLGVQLGGALETAHRAGILHHDVKPANILLSSYMHPGLTDFGIASTGSTGAATALSTRWAPPEAFRPGALDVRADVYSLAATLYHLLAGRAPYVLPGGPNDTEDLVSRAERGDLPPLGDGVPRSLERALATAMAPDRSVRPASAAEFVRSLQAIETELRLPNTPLELPGVHFAAAHIAGDGERTAARSIVEVVEPGGVAREDETSLRGERSDAAPPAPAGPGRVRAPRSGPPTRWLAIGAAAVVLAVAVVGIAIALAGSGDDGGGTSAPTTVFSIDGGAAAGLLSAVDDLDAAVTGDTIRFSWSAGDPADEYVYTVTSAGRSDTGRTSAAFVEVPAEAGTETCIRIIVTRAGFSDSGAREVCTTP